MILKSNKQNWKFSIFLLFLTLGLLFPHLSFARSAPCAPLLGFQKIETVLQLQNISNNPLGNYFLCNDLYFTAPFTVIAGVFAGTFDGNGKTLHNFQLQGATVSGLFEEIGSTGKVFNLIFLNPNIFASNGSVSEEIGFLAGINRGKISKVIVSGIGNIDVPGSDDPWSGLNMVGGLVGEVFGGSISNCHIFGDFTFSNNDSGGKTGGLVGYLREGGTIEDSSAEALLTGNVPHKGGLVATVGNGTIRRSFSSGSIQGEGFDIGGLVGSAVFATITQSYSLTNISVDATYVGGLVGQLFGTIASSFSLGNVSAFNSTSRVGGLVGNVNHGALVINSYAQGDVTGDANAYVGSLVGAASGNVEEIASIQFSYASGQSSGDSGLVGQLWNEHVEITASFFNTTANPNTNNPNGLGRTAAELMDIQTYTSDLPVNEQWNISYSFSSKNSIWKIHPLQTGFPFLAWE